MKFYFVVCFAHESISDDAPMVGEYESDVTRRITRAVESVFFKDAWQMENARSRGLAKKKKKKKITAMLLIVAATMQWNANFLFYANNASTTLVD